MYDRELLRISKGTLSRRSQMVGFILLCIPIVLSYVFFNGLSSRLWLRTSAPELLGRQELKLFSLKTKPARCARRQEERLHLSSPSRGSTSTQVRRIVEFVLCVSHVVSGTEQKITPLPFFHRLLFCWKWNVSQNSLQAKKNSDNYKDIGYHLLYRSILKYNKQCSLKQAKVRKMRLKINSTHATGLRSDGDGLTTCQVCGISHN
jgi:hypothetical protein